MNISSTLNEPNIMTYLAKDWVAPQTSYKDAMIESMTH